MLNWIDIDAAALRHNYETFCRLLDNTIVAPVLKSNAYGHGLPLVYEALAPLDPSWICTNYIEEAEQLRKLGYEGRILVVGPIFPEHLASATECRADIQIGNDLMLDAWCSLEDRPHAHFKFDTGMSRQGFLPHDAERVAQKAASFKENIAGIYTHFSNVEDVTDHSYAEYQLKQFQVAYDAFDQSGIRPMQHAASSASALLLKDSRFDMVRLGISLYGFWPSKATRLSYLQTAGKDLQLKPALGWRTRVTTLKPVRKGDYIGYGCTFRATHDMKVAVLPVGYFEGYPRVAGNQPSYVLIHGQRCPLVGRICMNMMVVDVTQLDNVDIGDEVTLIGTDGQETVTAGDIGDWSQTIHYEIVTCLQKDIPRRLV